MGKSNTLRLPIASEMERALAEQPTNVAIHDSKDKELIYDLANYFRSKNKYFVLVGPHNDQYSIHVQRLN